MVPGSVKPGSTLRSAPNVRIISTALTTRTSASATCTTTSTLRALARSRPALAPRDAPSAPASVCTACFSAVTDPKTTVEPSAMAAVNNSTGGYTAISLKRGRLLGPSETST